MDKGSDAVGTPTIRRVLGIRRKTLLPEVEFAPEHSAITAPVLGPVGILSSVVQWQPALLVQPRYVVKSQHGALAGNAENSRYSDGKVETTGAFHVLSLLFNGCVASYVLVTSGGTDGASASQCRDSPRVAGHPKLEWTPLPFRLTL